MTMGTLLPSAPVDDHDPCSHDRYSHPRPRPPSSASAIHCGLTLSSRSIKSLAVCLTITVLLVLVSALSLALFVNRGNGKGNAEDNSGSGRQSSGVNLTVPPPLPLPLPPPGVNLTVPPPLPLPLPPPVPEATRMPVAVTPVPAPVRPQVHVHLLVPAATTRPPKYIFSKEKATWFGATVPCLMFGMELVSIETLTEQVWIQIYLSRIGISGMENSWWTSGCLSTARPRKFIWTPNSPMNFTYWHASQPSDPGIQNCVEITSVGGSSTDGQTRWNDWECTHLLKFICEHPGRGLSDGYARL